MAVKVLIRRRADDRYATRIKALLCALESWACKQAGYFYGEHLEDLDRPGEYLCIGTWRSVKAFDEWARSAPSRQMERELISVCGMQSDSAVYIRNSHA